MPVVLHLDGFKFFFYANEGNPREPAHIHIRKSGAEAKFWLEPQVQLAQNDGFDAPTLRRIAEMVKNHQTQLQRNWYSLTNSYLYVVNEPTPKLSVYTHQNRPCLGRCHHERGLAVRCT
ncbi:MAG: DUF4160 domain-containing protein [Candidatus Competibacteraceae bacterium]|nr:DUF4160 domain-containing protein [Candidatus Competibacteraceae bacterium]